ncbi:unnamed protein product [Tilletia controversa]|nr:unnamed protein product [Tilletia controversa]
MMFWYRSHATQKWGNNTFNMPLKGYLLQRGGQEMDKHRFEALREDAKDKCHQYLAGLPDQPSQYKYKTFEYFHHRYRDVWDKLATDFSKDWVELTYCTTNWNTYTQPIDLGTQPIVNLNDQPWRIFVPAARRLGATFFVESAPFEDWRQNTRQRCRAAPPADRAGPKCIGSQLIVFAS